MRSVLLRAALLATGLAVMALMLAGMTASATSLPVQGGTLQAFSLAAQIDPPAAPLPATVDIQPDSIQTGSQGEDVAAYVELPEGYDVAAIEIGTVVLCASGGCVSAHAAPHEVGDHDGDQVSDRMVKFGRGSLIALVSDVEVPAGVSFTVSGLVAGVPFAGADTVQFVGPPTSPTPEASPEPEVSPTPEVPPAPGEPESTPPAG